MWRDTAFTRATGARLPLIAAPMAGGPTTPALVAEACEAGAFGVLSGGYRTPGAFRDAIAEVRARTSAPFGVNLLIPQPYRVDESEVAHAMALIERYAQELGIELPVPATHGDDVEGLLEVALDSGACLFSFTFGIPEPTWLAAFRSREVITCGTATSVGEARALIDAGVDMVCAQAAEAGGHRGSFQADAASSPIGLIALIPLLRDAVDAPVIAAGGVMDGRGIAAALTLGADAVQLGTAFLLCPEAGTSAPYRAAVHAARDTDTVLTSAFSGKVARGIRNRMTEELADAAVPPYPVMNSVTRPLRQAAAAAGRAEFLSLWAGQGVSAARALPVRQLVAALEAETTEASHRLGRQNDE